MQTNVYVDGFNTYKGIEQQVAFAEKRGDPIPDHWKWLDLRALGGRLATPKDVIHRVRYFTARVTAPKHDPDSPQRQNTYLRALDTSPDLHTHFGLFRSGRKRIPLFRNPTRFQEAVLRLLKMEPKRYPDGALSLPMLKTEEKGSDVNLATYLMVDAFRGDCEKAIIISNDTDLCEPIRIAVQELHIPVVIANPRGSTPHVDLKAVASEPRRIRLTPIADSQFPQTLTDAHGTFTRPPGW